jgi:hypothetical protein
MGGVSRSAQKSAMVVGSDSRRWCGGDRGVHGEGLHTHVALAERSYPTAQGVRTNQTQHPGTSASHDAGSSHCRTHADRVLPQAVAQKQV